MKLKAILHAYGKEYNIKSFWKRGMEVRRVDKDDSEIEKLNYRVCHRWKKEGESWQIVGGMSAIPSSSEPRIISFIFNF